MHCLLLQPLTALIGKFIYLLIITGVGLFLTLHSRVGKVHNSFGKSKIKLVLCFIIQDFKNRNNDFNLIFYQVDTIYIISDQ